jgi:RNA polymerase sigma-70 factor, ECF subfamily
MASILAFQTARRRIPVRRRFPCPRALLMETAAVPGDLVRRIQAGDRRAEGELVERYGEGLAFLLRRWARTQDAASDLYQETFRLALEKIRRGEVRDPDRLPGFLRSLAKNLSIDYYRRETRRGDREASIEATGELPLPDSEPGQLGNLLRQEKIGLVRRLLSELSVERDREILIRFYLHEEDKERIREDLGLSRPEFNVVLFRARRRYQALVEKALGGRVEV